MSDYKIDSLEVESTIIAPAATTSVAGLHSAGDKIKIDSVQSGATANSTDIVLLARANHTGTQSAATITGLATVATSGLKVDIALGNVDNTSDVNKPVSTAQQTALNLKADISAGVAFPEFVYSTTVVQSSVSIVHASVTELTSVSLVAGIYTFALVSLCQSTATTTGIGIRIGAGTAVLGITYGQWSISQGANGTAQEFQYNQLTALTNISSASVLAANTDFISRGMGSFNVTIAGTVAIQIRSETGTSVSIRPGSILLIKKVS